jgi:hypothetical protein
MFEVLVILVAIIPIVYLVNLLPITNHAKNIGGIFVGVTLAMVALVFLKQFLAF